MAAMQGCWQPAPCLAASDWKHQVAGAWPTCAVPWWQLWVIWRWRAEWQPSLFGVAQPGHRLGHPPSHPTSVYGANPAFNPVALGGKKGSFQWAWILWHKVFPMAGGSEECSGILSLAWVWSKLVGGAHMFYWETITTCIHGKHLPQGLFTMRWCMCDLCQTVFVGLWCYQHTIDKINLLCKFSIAALMMGWVSVCMFKAWNGCGW